MTTLAQTLLTKEEQDALKACVKDVEKRTSGEIVPVIASCSYDYPRAAHLGGLMLAILAALGGATLLGHDDMWTFLALFLVLYLVLSRLLAALPALKKPFITRSEMRAEVEEAAVTAFYLNGLHRTRDLTGIIIYVSVYERCVQVLADKGINDKVDPRVWEEVVAMVTEGIRQGRPGEALCRGVARCGELIAEHFPIRADDTDELPNLIIDGEARQPPLARPHSRSGISPKLHRAFAKQSPAAGLLDQRRPAMCNAIYLAALLAIALGGLTLLRCARSATPNADMLTRALASLEEPDCETPAEADHGVTDRAPDQGASARPSRPAWQG